MLRLLSLIMCISLFLSAKSTAPKKKGSLEKSSFQEILDRYLFIGDFSEKPAERQISGEVFWRYPFKIAPQTFDILMDKTQLDSMVFRVPGEGRHAEHFAKGRVEYLAGKYDQAHATWLAGRQQFDKDALANRRMEFFLALNSLQVARNKLVEVHGDQSNIDFKRLIQRAGYFLAAAYILRRDIADPQIDRHAPWALYNLSAIYYLLERWSLVAGATEEALSVLIKTGKKDFRPKLRQMMAEIYIKNMDLLPAIQELDTAIRQDPDPTEASRMFHRAGDIYYGLNNFELAEDVYMLASRIDESKTMFVPGQAALRAESLFWMGKFEDARRLMTVALEASLIRDKDWLMVSNTLPWVRLRIADTWLAQLEKASLKDRKMIADATRLAYYRVESEHPATEAARIAAVRGACMELPSYEGNNVEHARKLLEDVKLKQDVPPVLMELVWACLVGSYAERERTPEMVERVKEFSGKYPMSKFLERMVPAVREVQAVNIEPYFEKGNDFAATQFFEAKRKILFPKVSDDLSAKLFQSYVNTSRSDKAKEFWVQAKGKAKSDEDVLREMTFLVEVMTSEKKNSTLHKDFATAQRNIAKRTWKDKPNANARMFISRILNSTYGKEQLLWILDLAERWSAGDKDAVCSVVYPLAARISEQRRDREAVLAVRSRLDVVFPKSWPGLLDKNPTCAQSWLDLETRTHSLTELQDRYKGRADWKIAGPWLERIWVHSEALDKAGERDAAREIWQQIAKNGPEGSFEVRMAKTRLDPRQTEVEALWQ